MSPLVVGLDDTKASGAHIAGSSDHTLVVSMFMASCDIILEDAIGILLQFGATLVINTGSSMMFGLMRGDFRLRVPSSVSPLHPF